MDVFLHQKICQAILFSIYIQVLRDMYASLLTPTSSAVVVYCHWSFGPGKYGPLIIKMKLTNITRAHN